MRWAGAATGLALVLTAGCSWQSRPSREPNAVDQQLPFQQGVAASGVSPTKSLVTQEVPSGTVLTIHLQVALSSHTAHAEDSFEAVLDEPVVIEGQTVAPLGATVTGRVVTAHASRQLGDPGYLRLTLGNISIGGKQLPLRTSNTFAKAEPNKSHILAVMGSKSALGKPDGGTGPAKSDVAFSPAQQLTFRLPQALSVQN